MIVIVDPALDVALKYFISTSDVPPTEFYDSLRSLSSSTALKDDEIHVGRGMSSLTEE